MLHLDDALRPGVLQCVVQPVVRLVDDAVVGYEALVRLPDGEPPESLLARAQQAGLRPAVELACLRAAAALGAPPEGRLLFVNLGPGVLEDPGLPEVVRLLPPRLVLEITEHQALPDQADLTARLAPLLAGGARLAVDDTGSGYASLEHVVELRPEFLKLSSRLVSGLDEDPARQALVRALAAFAREVGSSVVAEGVEREGERLALLAAGVEHAQGWLLARPGPPWPQLAPRPSGPGSPALPPEPDQGELAEALDRCPDARTACQAWVSHLARHPGWMPSVYLHVAGRLRLQAQHGYWHVFDGMPFTAGVMGRTFTTGTTNFVRDVTQEEDYVDAVPGLASELSMPLRVSGEIVGVVNVESAVTLPDAAEDEVAVTMALLAARLTAVGIPGESRARLLGRHTAALTAAAGSGDVAALRDRATAAVRALTGLESALVAGPGLHGLHVQAASGPSAAMLRGLDRSTLTAMLDGVAAGQSGYTAGVPGGRAPGTQAALTAAGIRTVVTLPIDGRHLLVGADRATRAVAAEDIDLLEVLAGQLSGSLQTVAAVAALRDRAERDPLTGLGNRAGLRRRLDELSGQPYALAYVDVDRFKTVNDEQGHAAGDDLLVAVAEALASQARSTDQGLFRLGGDEFAAVLPATGLQDAVERARAMSEAVRGTGLGVTVSIGVAASTASDTAQSVLARADAALYDAKDAGRDRVHLRSPLGPVPVPVLPTARTAPEQAQPPEVPRVSSR